MKIRSSRIRKLRRKNWLVGIIIQIVFICYILIFTANYLTSDTTANFTNSSDVTDTLKVGTWNVDKEDDIDKKSEGKNESNNEDSIKEKDGAEKDKTGGGDQNPSEQAQILESNNQTSEKESNNETEKISTNETDNFTKENQIQEMQGDQSSNSNPTIDTNETNLNESKQSQNNN